jgi:hypothetical protein
MNYTTKKKTQFTMKFNIFAFLMAFIPSIIFAQSTTRYGITTSVGLISAPPETTYANYLDDDATHEIKFKNGSTIINAGLFAQKTWGWTYLRSDIVYSQYKLNYDINYAEARQFVSEASQDKVQNLDFMVTAGIMSHGFRLGVGTNMHFLMNYESAFANIEGFTSKTRTLTNGILGNIGFDFNAISVDFRYEKSLKSIGDHVFFNGTKSKMKSAPNQMSLAISYSF